MEDCWNKCVESNVNTHHIDHVSKFYHWKGDEPNIEWGFSSGNTNDKRHILEEIETINIVSYIETQVKNRRIPDKLFLDDKPPAVIVKLDVEGAEWSIIPGLLGSGVWCSLHTITCEFHLGRSETHFNNGTRSNFRKLMGEVLSTADFFKSYVCPTQFLRFDSEHYFLDNAPGLQLLHEFGNKTLP